MAAAELLVVVLLELLRQRELHVEHVVGELRVEPHRRLAERRIYPAIDVDASSTRHEELLFDRKQLQMVWKLRRVLSGLAADGNAAPGLELLVDRLKTFRTNDEFLTEIAKQPGM